jgi:hypothetical protein
MNPFPIETLGPGICLGIAVCFWVYAAYRFFRVWQIRRWPAASGTVVRSGIRTRKVWDSEDRTWSEVYEPDIAVAFDVGGRRYTATRITDSVDKGGPSYDYEFEAIKEYPEGDSVAVVYNPRQPEDSMLNRSAPSTAWFAIVMGFGFLTLACFFWLVTKPN